MLQALRGLWLLVGIPFSHSSHRPLQTFVLVRGVSVLSYWIEEAGPGR